MHRTRKDVELLGTDPLHRGRFSVDRYRLRFRTFSGAWSAEVAREVFERGHSVAVLPYDPVHDEVVLIEQIRIGAYAAGDEQPWLWEIVAGVIDAGETPDDVARRETMEETGLALTDVVALGEFYVSAGAVSERNRLYVGRVDSTGAGGLHGLSEEGEDIRAFAMSADAAFAAMAAGRIRTAAAFAALTWLKCERAALRKAWR